MAMHKHNSEHLSMHKQRNIDSDCISGLAFHEHSTDILALVYIHGVVILYLSTQIV